MSNTTRLLTSLLAFAVASPGWAQDADDWDYGEDPARKLAIAAVTFDTFGVAVRCVDGSFGVVLSGLPVGTGERSLGYRIGDEAERRTTWISGRDSTSAFSFWPRSVATQLSKGGRLAISVPDGERTRRYAVDIPPSSAAVGKVFQACGRSLETPSETPPSGEEFSGLRWARRPEVNFPDRARYEQGVAAILCYARANGGLRDCQIESEFPEGSGFGRAATLGAHQSARVAPAVTGESLEGRRLVFVARYKMEDAGSPPIPSRLPTRQED